MKILIAEDDPVLRKVLEKRITGWKHDVVITANGKDALDQLQQDNPPLIAILDWMMPELDGIEVCKVIRRIETLSPLYILMLTSKSRTDDVVAGLDAGANDFMTKPFAMNELKARLDVGIRLVNLQFELKEKIEKLKIAKTEIQKLEAKKD